MIAQPVIGPPSRNAVAKEPPNPAALLQRFHTQEFEPSPLDELSKLELTAEEVEMDSVVRSQDTQYFVDSNSPGFKVVKAKAGDTVANVAERVGVNVIDVAKFNGLFPNSVLGADREVKIPQKGAPETWQNISNRTGVSVADLLKANPGMTTPQGKVLVRTPSAAVRSTPYSRPNATKPSPADFSKLIGSKPIQGKNGKVSVVMNYLNEVLHDPYSMRIVRWSEVTRIVVNGEPYWRISIRYRAKNRMSAYVLSEQVFYIRHNKIMSTFEID